MARKAILETMDSHLAPEGEDPQGYGVKYMRHLAGEREFNGHLRRPGVYGLSSERAAEVRAAWEEIIMRAAKTIEERRKAA